MYGFIAFVGPVYNILTSVIMLFAGHFHSKNQNLGVVLGFVPDLVKLSKNCHRGDSFVLNDHMYRKLQFEY